MSVRAARGASLGQEGGMRENLVMEKDGLYWREMPRGGLGDVGHRRRRPRGQGAPHVLPASLRMHDHPRIEAPWNKTSYPQHTTHPPSQERRKEN